MPHSYQCKHGYHGSCTEPECNCPCHQPDHTPHKGSLPTPTKQT